MIVSSRFTVADISDVVPILEAVSTGILILSVLRDEDVSERRSAMVLIWFKSPDNFF